MSWIINAGAIPADSWVQDKQIGGGRVVGEGCHWLDFMQYLTGGHIISVSAAMVNKCGVVPICDDKMTITCSFSDGSVGTLHYFANGHRSYPKETFELFCDGKILKLDNFRVLRGYGWNRFRKMCLLRQDKGHKKQFSKFIESIIKTGKHLMAFEEIESVMLASFAAMDSAEQKKTIEL